MITKIREGEILRCARQVVKDNGFVALPVDPKRIAKNRGIMVQPWETETLGISGCLMKVGDDFGIGYSTAIKNTGFENFTVAHELGHFFLDGHVEALLDGGAHYSRSGYVSNDVHEKEADLFASELLMPEFLMRPAINKGGSGFAVIQRLAGEGETSIVATAIRYAKLADDPVAVILSEGQHVKWCFMSDGFRQLKGVYNLAKQTPIPPQSPTSGFNQNGQNIATGKRVEDTTLLRVWFERAPEIEIQEDVVGLGHYGKTLTILFSEESLEEYGNEEPDEDEGADTGMPSARWSQRDRNRF